VYWTKNIVNIPCESISRPPLFTVIVGHVKPFNDVTIDTGLVSVNDGVVTVNPHGFVIMRDRKRQYLLIEFMLSRYLTVQINHLFNSNASAMSVLSISDEQLPTYFHRKVRKPHPGSSQKRCTFPPLDERFQLPKLTLGKNGPFASSGIIGLGYRSWYGGLTPIPPLV
jgi:hypothetical protein